MCESEADDVLTERGIVVVPDVICNAGGITESYFEWVQDMACSLRTAAYIVACERILMARKDHGIYPG
jgi:glutamate dehydrogenase (NAD(P)+)